ncbi:MULTISPECIES: outer membrane lipoprotein carrier protein LolA [Burkholderia]|uniref:Outer membrane lipoprotein carrier protein LolA n=1 Tax=Burkholderia reimsis TaxID=2234132 RepID=A0A365QIW7_9BURK|nr:MULTISPECIES: outer membrane lipoprotein carrier protein LolA [Burkholderia]KVW03695.1 acyltransferase [Burkholderia cepacia]MBY4714958.1 outer membrane lipoprotein carrier protein LolA [Burkholderia cepacia]MBY4740468.1 outer membrane lipoprotein carrier protein LolA [Burkholderia cepacia]MBY4743155.1 outer membrane lipoprotein carrier protein LolA [Burkholderia cepacia]MBY4763059.1 outer membrane lipoprotein carrier protein LolA [Burkholderia cepacia]
MTAVRRLPTLTPALRRAVRTLAAAIAASTAAIALAAAPARAADAAPAWTLDRLMSTLAQHKSGRATFTETKYLSIATQPVESSGELVFVAPDHLEKHTLSPKPEHLVVDGDMLTVERNNRKYTLALARYPELGAFIDSIRATLAGNRFALEQVYQVALAGRGDDWTLTLTPLDSRMLKVVSTITLDGTRDLLRSVAIRQADGDRSVMRLQPVPANPN